MNPKLRQFLESKGLKSGASDADAVRYWQGLTGENRTKADALATAAEPEPAATAASTGPAAPAQATAAVDADAIARQAEDALLARMTEINGMAESLGLGEEWAKGHIGARTSLEAVRKDAIEKVAAKRQPVAVAVGQDHGRETIGVACADAMLMRLREIGPDGLAEEKDGKFVQRAAHPRARAFTGMSAKSICRAFIQGLGIPTDGIGDNKIAQMIFDRSVVGVHSTSDFPQLLANALNKSLVRQYQEIPVRWPLWCNRGTVPDFKQVKRVRFGEVPNLAEIKEGEDYTEFTIGDSQEVYTLAKYGKKFALTWEAIINDDLGGFARIPSQMVNSARRKEDALAVGVLTANAAMGDGNTLFDATNHGNQAATTAGIGAPTVATLSLALADMMTQTGESSNVTIEVEPKFIIAPVALMGTIDTLLASQANPAASNSGVSNIWRGKLTPIYYGLLDASSVVKWYLAADPNLMDTIELGFLEGYDSPSMMTVDNMSPDRREYFIRHVIGAKALDWRGLYYNPGA